MTTHLPQDKQRHFNIANLLDDAADAIRQRTKDSYAAGYISLDEYMDARARELELRTSIQRIVAADLSALLKGLEDELDSIEQSIAGAQDRIETIKDVQKGLEIVASLVVLAGAIVSQDPKAIVKASKGVLDAGTA